jgi:hypothetical protein
VEYVTLPKIELGNPELDAAIEEYRKGIMNANNWRVTGNGIFHPSGTGGFSLRINNGGGAISAVVQTGGITAAPSANKLGVGNVRLRTRENDNLYDAEIVKCYSTFRVAVAAGTRVEVVWDGPDVKLVGADCPLT